MEKVKPKVAVINSSTDILEAFQLYLTELDYPSVTGHVYSFKTGESDFIEFLAENDPQIIIFDISPPYEENWAFFKLIANLKQTEDIKFVLTTTNKAVLEKLVGPTKAFEIVGKPFDMKKVVLTVDQAAKGKTKSQKPEATSERKSGKLL